MKVAICGGHFSPAFALIEELVKTPDIKIVFFGRKYATEGSVSLSAEYRIVSGAGIKSRWIVAGRYQRVFSAHTLQALLKIPVGFLQSLFYLILERPSLIVSFGGSLSLPVVFCGWLLGIDSITHEQATAPGLATKINSFFVKKVFVSWPQTKKYFDNKKVEVIGNLTRKLIFNKKAKNQKIARFLLGGKKIIYITGGNQGSHILNQFTFKWIGKVNNFAIVHQVGTANFKNDIEKAQKITKDNYLAIDFVKPEDIGAVLNRAFLIISRSGANTCWEIAKLTKPSILVPLPVSSGSEQEKNAMFLKKAGLAEVIHQRDLNDEQVGKVIEKVSKNYQKYVKDGKAFAKDLPSNASQKLASYIAAWKNV